MSKSITIESFLDKHRAQEAMPEVAALLEKGETFQSIFKMSSHDLEERFESAYREFERGDVASAMDDFLLLCCLNPYDTRYWTFLGACQANLEDHAQAMISYGIAASLDWNNPYPNFYMTSSLLALGDKEDAKISLEMALDIAKQDHAHRALEDEIRMLLKKLN